MTDRHIAQETRCKRCGKSAQIVAIYRGGSVSIEACDPCDRLMNAVRDAHVPRPRRIEVQLKAAK